MMGSRGGKRNQFLLDIHIDNKFDISEQRSLAPLLCAPVLPDKQCVSGKAGNANGVALNGRVNSAFIGSFCRP